MAREPAEAAGHGGFRARGAAFLLHHLDPDAMLSAWQPHMAALPDAPWLAPIDFIVWNDAREIARQSRFRDIRPAPLSDPEISDLVAFLKALTGTTSVSSPPFGTPDAVPSRLPVDR